MAFVAPLLCSIVAALFVLFPERTLRKNKVALYFSATGALWLLLLIYTYSAAASPAGIAVIRALITLFAYGVPGIMLLVRYLKRDRITQSLSDKYSGITHLHWIVICIALEGCLLALGIALGRVESIGIWNGINATAIAIQQILLTDYMIRRGKPRMSGMNGTGNANSTGDTGGSAGSGISILAEQRTEQQLSRKMLENYFNLKRPYIDPEFSLVDLAAAMGVNRSEISAFINRTYGMNFKRYVNRWRLQEYQRLMTLPSNERKIPHRILPMAGFTDSRHYQRAMAQENAASNGEATVGEVVADKASANEMAASDKAAGQTPGKP